ncbi:hypothetical protein [Desulfonatronum thioautotrophicum]|uniref:hypothetical protein n=1 Tax=Desulfonatronum thioautotrophicum TaxID=617001 RepID=UPI0012948585|nr:hypothetical protein [Desulfonatronum thioautotrophicum]
MPYETSAVFAELLDDALTLQRPSICLPCGAAMPRKGKIAPKKQRVDSLHNHAKKSSAIKGYSVPIFPLKA